jgi:hypothetical protein
MGLVYPRLSIRILLAAATNLDDVSAMESDCKMSPADSAPIARRSHRSRVGNGSSLLPNCDGRSLWARLMRDTLQNLQAHCGGELSETQRLAARRVSTLEAELVYLEDKFARARAEGREPEIAELDLYGRLADRQRRLAEAALGWKRVPRDVTPPDPLTYGR